MREDHEGGRGRPPLVRDRAGVPDDDPHRDDPHLASGLARRWLPFPSRPVLLFGGRVERVRTGGGGDHGEVLHERGTEDRGDQRGSVSGPVGVLGGDRARDGVRRPSVAEQVYSDEGRRGVRSVHQHRPQAHQRQLERGRLPHQLQHRQDSRGGRPLLHPRTLHGKTRRQTSRTYPAIWRRQRGQTHRHS